MSRSVINTKYTKSRLNLNIYYFVLKQTSCPPSFVLFLSSLALLAGYHPSVTPDCLSYGTLLSDNSSPTQRIVIKVL